MCVDGEKFGPRIKGEEKNTEIYLHWKCEYKRDSSVILRVTEQTFKS